MKASELTISEMEILMSKNQLEFMYTNYKGKVGMRKVIPLKLFFGTSSYHLDKDNNPIYAMYLMAFDVEKQSCRDFKISDIDIELSV